MRYSMIEGHSNILSIPNLLDRFGGPAPKWRHSTTRLGSSRRGNELTRGIRYEYLSHAIGPLPRVGLPGYLSSCPALQDGCNETEVLSTSRFISPRCCTRIRKSYDTSPSAQKTTLINLSGTPTIIACFDARMRHSDSFLLYPSSMLAEILDCGMHPLNYGIQNMQW